jgi:NAD(P) transhydrogenase
LPGIVWAPFTHRSTATGTKETGRLAVGALAGHPAQAGSPGVVRPPLTVGTGAVDPNDWADPDGTAEAEAEAKDAEGAAGADVADAVGADPCGGAPARVVPHPAASVPAASSAAVTAHTRVPAPRAAAIGAFCVFMALPRFSGHLLDGARVADGFTSSRVLPHIAPPRGRGSRADDYERNATKLQFPAWTSQTWRVHDYDLLVIGSGPGGQKAAIAAAKLDRRVAVVERPQMLGGVCVNTGTIPSKTLREAILYLTGTGQREIYGQAYRVKDDITVADLTARTSHVVSRENDVVRSQLARNRVTIIQGVGYFVGPHAVEVEDVGGRVRKATADKIVIATGTKPARPATVAFDEKAVIDSDGMNHLDKVPRSMVVVGAGVIGMEYASMFAALGTKVTVVEKRMTMLEFCDEEVVEALKYHLRDLAVTFRFGETVASVEAHPDGAITVLRSGKRIPADTVLYSAGRQGMTDGLNLPAAGLTADERGRIAVDEFYRTKVEHVYAVGDVIGFPALAATSMEQGRRAALHAFGEPVSSNNVPQPIGIYSIPEISFVGRTEAELTEACVPFEVGVSRYRELARGQIVGDSYGVLKLLVSPEDRTLLGVHVFGTGATELIHIGQAVMGCGGTVDYLVDAVFNYPTLAESYKVAALDATNKMRAVTRLSG